MSHVCKIELEIRDLDALARACAALGLELVRDQRTYRWYGESVGDTPLPEGFSVQELGHCQHAIRIPGNDRAYEIGVVRRRDGRPGYSLLWDSWSGGFGLVDKVGATAGKLKQAYGAEVSMKELRAQGFTVSRKVDAAGRIILNATR